MPEEKTALNFLLAAKDKPWGPRLFAAGIAGAQEGPKIVKNLMIEWGINPETETGAKELSHNEEIYTAAAKFCENTEFTVSTSNVKY
jgi:hypothetical protein